MFNFKKAQTQTWWIVIAAIIAIVVMALVLWFVTDKGGKGMETVGDALDSFGDCDSDDVADFYDKCPCKYGTTDNEDYPGCPSSVTEENIDENKECTDAEKEECK
ncbi:hypothetical protein HN385_06910 [archaeon]|jgi:hypothetical protein|nr:hypothetical protein [archaeon]MBT3451003.1 hypothetical protein [archaeon]MBT6868577.1 hypothetical protein [archaeon]MBT7193109.1 hypothetical protein [archaeon]MBT7380426.1 hypothetical protein [archaeon]